MPLPALPATLAQWVAFYAGMNLPVLRHTAQAFASLAATVDSVDARTIADHVLEDPMMTLKVFAWSATLRSRRQTTELETIEPVILMCGVEPFFRHFAELSTIERALATDTRALAGALRVVSRSYRASAYARDWALRRRDLDTEVILIAALLHDFVEVLMWVCAPAASLQIQERQHADRSLRSADLQREVFGVSFSELQAALVREWHLPELLISLLDDHHANHPRVRNVLFAVNLARHSARGWDDAALHDDFEDIAGLLNTTPGHVRDLVIPADILRA
ncbi:MAG: HDOD domain-containing protein [Pseudomonadota bacterium]|nr:HDOD domain-containing protein [Pseudomonadota bacterium]